MNAVTLVVPGRLDTRTGGYIYDRRIIEGLRRRGWQVDVRELDGSFPHPSAAAVDEAARVFHALPSGARVLVDSLAFGAIPDVIVGEAPRLRIVALMHLPLAADPALPPAAAERVARNEGRALRAAARVVATGHAARALLAPYDIPPDRIAIVEPGTDRAPLARGSRGGAPVSLLCVATLNPGKGHEILLRALSAVPRERWRLVCAGSLTRSQATAERVRALAAALALEDRVEFAGDLDGRALAAAYDAADVLVLASCRETYGMAVAEALARGIPVVATDTGAARQLLEDSAGLIVPAGDIGALARALSRVTGDAELRARLAAGARRARERLPSWDDAAARMAEVLST